MMDRRIDKGRNLTKSKQNGINIGRRWVEIQTNNPTIRITYSNGSDSTSQDEKPSTFWYLLIKAWKLLPQSLWLKKSKIKEVIE